MLKLSTTALAGESIELLRQPNIGLFDATHYLPVYCLMSSECEI